MLQRALEEATDENSQGKNKWNEINKRSQKA